MRYFLILLILTTYFGVFGQSKIPYPKPVVIDLSEPKIGMPKGLDKASKKKWKVLKRQDKLKSIANNHLYDFKLDSIQNSYIEKYVSKDLNKSSLDSLSNTGLKKYLKDSLYQVSATYKQSQIQELSQKYKISDSLVDYTSEMLSKTIEKPDSLSLNSEFKKGNFSNRLNAPSFSKDSLKHFNYKGAFTRLSMDSSLIKQYDSDGYVDDLTQLNDNLSTKDSLQHHNYKKALNELPLDSTLMNQYTYDGYVNDLTQLNDSLASVDYNGMALTLAEKRLEQSVTSTDYLSSLSLPTEKNSSENVLASYEEMINSQQYKDIMKDIPGKKAEIEKAIETKEIKLDSLPIKPNFFLGKEQQLLDAQKKLALIKQKRSFMDVLRSFVNQDMESLEQKTFTQKFNLTGHIQIGGHDPLLIDYSPAIAYQFTGKASFGIGASGRVKIGNDSTKEEDLVAYRAFLDYKIVGNIFIHTEWENTGQKTLNTVTDQEERTWTNRWLLGLGKDFNFSPKVKGNILLLYNFNSENNTPHGQRFQVRYGFKI